jgi:putative hydrolase of the HAD superfamily/pyrimidine and pyridine-specific 5'-nucleotidase
VGSSALVPGADVALESIHNIKEALPELWVEADGEHVDAVLRATAVETTVLA